MRTRILILCGVTLVYVALLTGFAQAQVVGFADLRDKDGNIVGTADFREDEDAVLVFLRVKDLPPGLHGVHIHTTGKCEDPGFTSAGGHFNSGGKKHGLRSAEGSHAGDLPNLYVAKNGSGRYQVLDDKITLSSGVNTIFDSDGSALVIHAAGDDDITDPTGNSGDRIACGVIVKGKR
jgi:Cu-Zn family superoxide dismutase